MAPLSLTSPRERALSIAFALALAVPLAVGFLPTAHTFGRLVANFLGVSGQAIDLAFFPAMALLFHLSLPGRKKTAERVALRPLLVGGIFPVLVALAHGAFIPQVPSTAEGFLWYVLVAPLGEELLFRGWVYGLIERLWPGKKLTLTFPFPAAVWLSALAFSVWHAQNHDPFQVGYTFFTGLWFGYLRWRTDGLAIPFVFHALINLAANIL